VLQEADFHLRGQKLNKLREHMFHASAFGRHARALYWTNSDVNRVCLIVVFEGHSSAIYSPCNYCCCVKNINHVFLLPMELKWVGNGENCVSNYGDIANGVLQARAHLI
jgi:hypothetical protein